MLSISPQSTSKPSESADFCNAGIRSRMLTGRETPYYINSAWEHEYCLLLWFCTALVIKQEGFFSLYLVFQLFLLPVELLLLTRVS